MSAEGDRLGDDERRAADDEREGEEERALDAAGQGDQQGRDRDRDGSLDDELGRPERLRREQVVDDHDEQAGQGEEDEDGRLRLGPQAGRRDDGGRRQDEHPGHDPDDPIVGLGRHPVVGHRSLEAADDDRLGGAPLGIDGRRDVAGDGTRATEQRRHEDERHEREVGQDGDADQDEDRSDGHACPR